MDRDEDKVKQTITVKNGVETELAVQPVVPFEPGHVPVIGTAVNSFTSLPVAAS